MKTLNALTRTVVDCKLQIAVIADEAEKLHPADLSARVMHRFDEWRQLSEDLQSATLELAERFGIDVREG